MATRKRGGPIAGLLTVPKPLPDDEYDEGSSPLAEEARSVDEAPPVAQVPPETPDIQLVPEAPPASQLTGPPRKGPPGTIRLNEAAGRRLWEAYLEAKSADPFLSYRQFASQVVGDGLAVLERARPRSVQ